jgi:hypothetical protein
MTLEQEIRAALNWSPIKGPTFTANRSVCGYHEYDMRDLDAPAQHPLCGTCTTVNRFPIIFVVLGRKGICTDVARVILWFFSRDLVEYISSGRRHWGDWKSRKPATSRGYIDCTSDDISADLMSYKLYLAGALTLDDLKNRQHQQ